MAVAIDMQVVPAGHDEVLAGKLFEIGERAEDWRVPFDEITSLLEADERRHFQRLRGRYVLTGQTLASLTQPAANGAIRELHRGSLHFGSRVPQATYLTKSPRDPENEQVRKPGRPDLRSAVLIFKGVTKSTASQLILRHTVEPWGD